MSDEITLTQNENDGKKKLANWSMNEKTILQGKKADMNYSKYLIVQ